MTDDLAQRTRSLVARMAPEPPSDADPSWPADDRRLVADLGFDSIRLMELTVALEQVFSLPRHDPAQLVDVQRVGDVIALVARESPREAGLVDG